MIHASDKLRHVLCFMMLSGASFLALGANSFLEGSVNDLGVPDTENSGISGVWIKVLDVRSKEVGSGLTDARGRYRIKLSRSGGFAFYEKLGFQPRPAVREIVDLAKAQQPVFLVREDPSATVEYYKTVANNLHAPAAPASQADIVERAYLVAGLPQPAKAQVLDNLKTLGAHQMLAEVQTAEQSVWRVDSALAKKFSEKAPKGWAVNFSTVGNTVKLTGYVSTPADITKAEELARSVAGVKHVENAIWVKY